MYWKIRNLEEGILTLRKSEKLFLRIMSIPGKANLVSSKIAETLQIERVK